MKVILFIILNILGCSTTQPSQTKDLKVRNVGYIKLVDSYNKTFSISTKAGEIYLPINLNEKFKQDGLKVIFEGTIDTSRLKNVRLAGFPIRLDKIRAK